MTLDLVKDTQTEQTKGLEGNIVKTGNDLFYSFSNNNNGFGKRGVFIKELAPFINNEHFNIVAGMILRDTALKSGLLKIGERIRKTSLRAKTLPTHDIVVERPEGENVLNMKNEEGVSLTDFEVGLADTEIKLYEKKDGELLFDITDLNQENPELYKKYPHGKQWVFRNSGIKPTDMIMISPEKLLVLDITSPTIEWLGFQLGNILINRNEEIINKYSKVAQSGVLSNTEFKPKFTTIEERYISPEFKRLIMSENLAIRINFVSLLGGGAIMGVAFELVNLEENQIVGDYKFSILLKELE